MGMRKVSTDWVGHTLRRTTGWQPQRQAVALGTLSLVVGIIIGALYLAQSSSTSTVGRQLEELIAVRDRLEQENERLRIEISGLQAVPRLLARAQELGFRIAEPNEIEYLTVEGYNPNRERIVTAAESEADTLPIYDESPTGWFQQQWDTFQSQLEGFTNQEGE